MYTLEEIDGIIEKFSRLQNISREPANLYEPLDYMMSIGGKRIRPKLCLLACDLAGRELDQPAIFPAMALEVFHEFTLIHDDIMDRSDTRRGRPTVYKQWNENIAILSGDAMSILAYKYLAHTPAEVLPQALDLFSTTATALIEKGEIIKAEQVLDKAIEVMPTKDFPYNVSMFHSINEWSVLGIVEDYFRIGRPDKALAVGNQLGKETIKMLVYFSTPTGPGDEDVLDKRCADDAATLYYYLIRMYNNFDCKDEAKQLETWLKEL